MKGKVIFVMPFDGFWHNLSNGTHLPGALLSAASVLYKKGFDVKIIDQRIDKDWKEKLVAGLKAKPLFVGITSMTGSQITSALEISKIVKEYGCTSVWGGVHASLLPEQTLENPYIDIIVKGEGEITSYELAKAIKGRKNLSTVKGIYYKDKNNNIVKTEERGFLNLEKLPDLPYKLVNVNNYIYTFQGEKFINFFSSRGCPYNCKFCYNTVFNKKVWRCLSAKTVIKRISKLRKDYKFDGIWFRDDNFFVNKQRAVEIIKGISKLGLSWGTSGARLDLLATFDNNMIDTINKSNCKFLFIGVESGSDKILKLIGKNITSRQIVDVNKKVLSKINAVQRMNFMIGLPAENRNDLKKTISLSYRILNDNKNAIISQYQIFTPYPGTELYDYALKKGFVEPKSLEEWSHYRFELSNIPFFDEDYKKTLRMLAFVSWFIDDKLQQYAGKIIVKILAKLYAPIAKYRLKTLDSRFLLDVKLAEIVGF